MDISNNLEVINIFKRTPSNVFVNGVGYTLPKVSYVESENYLIVYGKSSKYTVQLVLPFDSILKESAFITFVTNEIYASGQMQENHKFALLTATDLNKVVQVEERLTKQSSTFKNGMIHISHWETHPSVDMTLEDENGQKVELFLYPLPSGTPLGIKKTISYKLIGKSIKKNNVNHIASKELEQLNLADFYRHAIWEFDYSNESKSENMVKPINQASFEKLEDFLIFGQLVLENQTINVLCFITQTPELILRHIETFDEKEYPFLEDLYRLCTIEEFVNLTLLGKSYELDFINGITYLK